MRIGFFITGTDTDAGKTFFTAILLGLLREAGVNAAPMKPVQTGCRRQGNMLVPPDLTFLLDAAGMDVSPEDRDLMCPYRYEPACSPHLAAEQANQPICMEMIVRAFEILHQRWPVLLVEGAGGVFVPLDRRLTMLNLMRRMGLPVLLASRPGLGTINHTLLSIRVLRSAGLDVMGMVTVQTRAEPYGLIEQDNRRTIAEFSGVPVLGHLTHCARTAAGSLPDPLAYRHALQPLVERIVTAAHNSAPAHPANSDQ